MAIVTLTSGTVPNPAREPVVLDVALTELEVELYESLEAVPERARALVRRARAARDRFAVARAELILSDAWSRAGDHAPALELQRRIAAEAPCAGIRARAGCYMASTLFRLGLWIECRQAADDAVRLLDDRCPETWLCEHRMVLALFTSYDRGPGVDYELWEDCVRRARRLGYETLRLAVLNNYAWVAWQGGSAERARALADEMTAILDAGTAAPAGPVLDTLAAIRISHGAHAEAERLVLAGLEGDRHVEIDTRGVLLIRLAAIRRHQGREAEAIALLERGRAEILPRTPVYAIDALAELADLDAARGDYRRAYRRLRRAGIERDALARAEDRRQAAVLQSVHATAAERDQRLYWQELASRDSLTGLANRRRLEEALPDWLAAGSVALAMIDVDEFKQINDEHSHDVGDAILRELADIVSEHARALGADALAVRLGGEEFVIVAPGLDAAAAAPALQRLRADVAGRQFADLPPGRRVTVSIGLAWAAAGTETRSGLLGQADARLYVAKRSGRNRLEVDVGAAVLSGPGS